jgi:hypothetical protein
MTTLSKFDAAPIPASRHFEQGLRSAKSLFDWQTANH